MNIDIDNIINFIDHIYETINIYHTLILYDDIDVSILNKLILKLKEKDYPIDFYTDNKNITDMELKSRIIVVNSTNIYKYFHEKNNDLSDFNIVLCMDFNSDKVLHEKLVNQVRFAEKMYIFSCIKV